MKVCLTLCIRLLLAVLDQLERTMLFKNLMGLGLNGCEESFIAKATDVHISGIVWHSIVSYHSLGHLG